MNFSSIGDNTVIHTAASLPTGMPAIVHIGNNVTVGANCTLYSCFVGDDVYIGDKSVIMEGARLENQSMLAPGSVVPPGRLIPAKQLWGGNPVEYIRDLNIGEVWANYAFSYTNTQLGDSHREEFTVWPSAYLQKPTRKEDVEVGKEDWEQQIMARDFYKGFIKFYA